MRRILLSALLAALAFPAAALAGTSLTPAEAALAERDASLRGLKSTSESSRKKVKEDADARNRRSVKSAVIDTRARRGGRLSRRLGR